MYGLKKNWKTKNVVNFFLKHVHVDHVRCHAKNYVLTHTQRITHCKSNTYNEYFIHTCTIFSGRAPPKRITVNGVSFVNECGRGKAKRKGLNMMKSIVKTCGNVEKSPSCNRYTIVWFYPIFVLF